MPGRYVYWLKGGLGMEKFVGRAAQWDKLKAVLEAPAKRGLTIKFIKGPSGVGKSTLFQKVLAGIDLESRGILKLELTGVDRTIPVGKDIQALAAIDQLVGALIRSAVGPGISLRPPGYFFAKTRSAMAAVAEVRAGLTKELMQRGINPDDEVALQRMLPAGARLGARVAKFIPGVKDFVDVETVDGATRDGAVVMDDLKSIASTGVHFWERLGLNTRSTRREAAKVDPDELLAAALVQDLKAILLGKHDNKLEPGLGKIPQLKKLLLVLEDYEATHALVHDFLIPRLLDKLKVSGIDATLLVISRFNPKAMSPRWKQYDGEIQGGPITLDPLERSEVVELMEHYRIVDPLEHERAWKETAGLPFHLAMLIEEIEDGGRDSSALLQLYDRVTMWMSPQERGWLHQALYMDTVNQDTLAEVLGSEELGVAAYNWFQREGSILDPVQRGPAGEPQLLEFVRSRLCEYLQMRSPKQVAELRQRAVAALQDQPETGHRPSVEPAGAR